MEICLCCPATPTEGWIWLFPGAGQAMMGPVAQSWANLSSGAPPAAREALGGVADRNPLTVLHGSGGTYRTLVRSLEDLLCGLWASQVSSMSSEGWRPRSSCCQPACSCWEPLVITRGRWHELLYKGFEISRNDIKPMEIKFLP